MTEQEQKEDEAMMERWRAFKENEFYYDRVPSALDSFEAGWKAAKEYFKNG